MTVKQISVFIENREGRLKEVLRVLKEHGVNIISMSLADTTEYGLLRLIVNEPERGSNALLENGFSGMTTDVFVVKLPHTAGSLQNILEIVAENNINIEYMYGLSVEGEDASIVLKVKNLDKMAGVLRDNGIETMSTEELKKY